MSRSTTMYIRALIALVALPVIGSAGSPQTIGFDAIPNQILGISPFVIVAQASSGLPVSFASNMPAVCRNSGSLVMLLSVGTCSITASQGGNGSFNASSPVTRTFSVSQAKVVGAFIAATGSPFAVGTNPDSLVMGDFNGDGIPDLAAANYASGTVTVLLGNGSGGFTAAVGSPFIVGSGSDFILTGDFNGDGILDLATANSASSSVTVLLGNGAGGFTAAANSPFAVGTTPYSIVVADFNGDGIEDFATANESSNNITVMLGNGAGGFAPSTGSPFPVQVEPRFMAVGDFNGDGIQILPSPTLAAVP